MAVEAIGSRHARHSGFIIAAVCLAGALWFGYDGWMGGYRDKQLAQNDGKPTANLLFNQYAPIPLVAVAAFAVVSALRLTSRKIAADDHGLTTASGRLITYDDIKKIDKRFFDKAGHFTVTYSDAGTERQLKISDRKYDNLGLLLDELVRRTGAAPVSASQNSKNSTEQS